jgi:hypothetical protein
MPTIPSLSKWGCRNEPTALEGIFGTRGVELHYRKELKWDFRKSIRRGAASFNITLGRREGCAHISMAGRAERER